MEVVREAPIFDNYCNHIGSTRDAKNNVFLAGTVQCKDKDNPRFNKTDVIIKRRQQGTAVYTVVHVFDEETYGKHGYCTLEAVGKHLVCFLSERDDDGTIGVAYRIYDVCEV